LGLLLPLAERSAVQVDELDHRDDFQDALALAAEDPDPRRLGEDRVPLAALGASVGARQDATEDVLRVLLRPDEDAEKLAGREPGDPVPDE
jgi:hypothetical protein